MNTVRALALAAVATGAAAEAMHNGIPQDKVIEILPRVARDDTCAELPKLCTGPAMMYGYATTVVYLCPETTTTREPSTVHVTITKTTTVTPLPEVEPTDGPSRSSVVVAPAPVSTEEPDTTATIHSTLTKYKTITLVVNSGDPLDATTPPAAVSITGYLSATIPTELSSATHPLPTETEEPVYTIQTSTNPAVTSTSGYNFPTMAPPVINGTTTGIFYSAPFANSSLVQPTPFFPNTTSAHSHYALPTLSVVNRAPEAKETTNGAAGKLGASIAALAFGMVVVVFAA
ncbi:hypothetical protein BU25DRAFT_407010 [Macroventuria anomochaeta]|uniref:Uncharacterized protein n=1 Tax=Macroventuria anomochaeta TaxID=301207 RepID=A0ACB6SDW5_9PLEO|nr:uncharacterized protein BU25DRAFT_407010 [Macroventuria anomochaeta]KAF2632480.1 hypothetical protein BU25DRAFT_407010 [Macroventuria anomochaeta]